MTIDILLNKVHRITVRIWIIII